MRRIPVLAGVAAAFLLGTATAAQSQSLGDRLKRRAKEAAERTVEQRVDQKTTEATNAALDKGENTVKCAATDKKCIDNAKKAGKQVVTDDNAGTTPAANAEPTSGGGAAKGEPTVNTGKDFTPGTRVLFATDFSKEELGEFPRRLELVSGNMEVADVGGKRYLRVTSANAKVDIPLPEVLPEKFTMEFDFKMAGGYNEYMYFTEQEEERAYLLFNPWDAGIEGPKSYRVVSRYSNDGETKIVPVQIMADGKYVKVYVNGARVANAPNADLGRSNKIRFEIDADAEKPILIGNIRVAAGGKDLYKALSESGRVTTEGVFFDTNSDKIRAESAPALKEIGDMMAQHPELKIRIEGHTDNVGNADANMTLSEKRALAVKSYLVNNLSVDAARLTSKGLGASKPVADNTTDEGRQKNRRVELVKQ